MARLLLIDDDPSLLDMLALGLEDAGHTVRVARDGAEGLALIRDGAFELIVSDVNMPRVDGFSLCRKLRAQGDLTPLVLLTSRDNEIDEALGLELGADDYVAKPFSTRVLLARVASLLRREALRKGAQSAQGTFTLNALELSPERIEVRFGGALIAVTVTEFRLVEALARNAGRVLSRDRLMELMRGDDSVVADRIVDTYVRRLRRKFEAADARFDRIETVIGAGYRWLT